jgi:hypothetical protein
MYMLYRARQGVLDKCGKDIEEVGPRAKHASGWYGPGRAAAAQDDSSGLGVQGSRGLGHGVQGSGPRAQNLGFRV